MNSSNIAVLGCGYWGQNLVRNFQELGVLKLVCDPVPAALDRARQIAPGVEAETQFKAVLARPDITAVAIATPAETHESLAIQALACGKDVYVEKPMALNVAQGLRMREAAIKHERILMVGHLLEYHPAVIKLKEIVAKGGLGKVNYLYSNRLNFGKIRIEENALWSFAPHDIAVILSLTGELPIEVTCAGGSYITPNLADVTVSCLHFRTGVRAHVFVSWLHPFKAQQLVVVGDKGMAVFDDMAKDHKLLLYEQRVELNNRQPVLQKGHARPISLPADEPLRNECQHFLNCIRTRETPRTDADNGLRVLRVLEACQTSLELNGQPTILRRES